MHRFIFLLWCDIMVVGYCVNKYLGSSNCTFSEDMALNEFAAIGVKAIYNSCAVSECDFVAKCNDVANKEGRGLPKTKTSTTALGVLQRTYARSKVEISPVITFKCQPFVQGWQYRQRRLDCGHH